jgi:hypothetical protein
MGRRKEDGKGFALQGSKRILVLIELKKYLSGCWEI